jgi:hypothetical protein
LNLPILAITATTTGVDLPLEDGGLVLSEITGRATRIAERFRQQQTADYSGFALDPAMELVRRRELCKRSTLPISRLKAPTIITRPH